MQGWIKLHRRITEHWIWQDPEYLRMWIYLLLDVNHEDRKIIWNKQIVEVKRGEKITSLKKLAYEFNCSREKIRHFLKLLKDDTMITVDSNTQYTHIRVCKYDDYQIEQHAGKTPGKRRENAGKTPSDTNKNDKNDKNDKNEKEYSEKVESLYRDVVVFFDEDLRPKDKKKEAAWKEVLRQLIEIDNETPEMIKHVVKHARMDDFWKTNFLSLAKLRKKDTKQDLKYFEIYKAKWPIKQYSEDEAWFYEGYNK